MSVLEQLRRTGHEPQLPKALKPKRPPACFPALDRVNDAKTPEKLEDEIEKVSKMLRDAARHGARYPEEPQISDYVLIEPVLLDDGDPLETANVLGFADCRLLPVERVGWKVTGIPERPGDDNGPAVWDAVLPLRWDGGCLSATEPVGFRAISLADDYVCPEDWPAAYGWNRVFNAALVGVRRLVDFYFRKLECVGDEMPEQHFSPVRYRIAVEGAMLGTNDVTPIKGRVYLPWDTTPFVFKDGETTALVKPSIEVFVQGQGKDVHPDGSWSEIRGSGSWGVLPGNIQDFRAGVGSMLVRCNYGEYVEEMRSQAAAVAVEETKKESVTEIVVSSETIQ